MTSARADAPPPARDVLAGVRLGEGEDPARDGAQRRASLHGFPKQEVVLHGPVPDGDGGGRGASPTAGGACASAGGDIARTSRAHGEMAERRRRCGFAREAGNPRPTRFAAQRPNWRASRSTPNEA